MSVVPAMINGGNTSVQTTTAGTTFAQFPQQKAKQLTISNDTGVTVVFTVDGTGVAIPVFNSTYYTIYGIQDCNRIWVQRADQSTTQVTVKARWEGEGV
jgi:hypothetical protein